MASIDFDEYSEKMTDNAKSSLAKAENLARDFGSPYIGTEHLLLGILSQSGSIAAKVMQTVGITFDNAKSSLKLSLKTSSGKQAYKGLSETAKLTLRMSWHIAREFNQSFCGTEHILFSILSQKNARATILLRDMNTEVEMILAQLEDYFSRQQYDAAESSNATEAPRAKRQKNPIDQYGSDITEEAKRARLDPVIGRESEIRRLITILNRRTKNNPVLIGEPGVGKTAIVEGLAQRIIAGDVPDNLVGKRLVRLDMAGLVAGTKYRGEFEERLKNLLDSILNNKDTILFIDEMHLIVGAGAAEGAIDAGNMLKPALARGDIQIIGATTIDEYDKHIEKDAALERRFQPIIVPETDQTETIAILRGLRGHYENYHNVTIDDNVIKLAVRLASRYITDRYMPDKAIDLIDEAAAYVRTSYSRSDKQNRLAREIKDHSQSLKMAAEQGEYEQAAQIKGRLSILQRKLHLATKPDVKKSRLLLKEEDIAHVLSTMTGIPLRKILKSEANYLLDLEKHLSRYVIGQNDAISAVARAIRRNRSGISDSQRPIGSFVFLGPTGVGKTELARILAKEFYASDSALVKIDMSEYGEQHTVSRLIGAPAGYIGYDEGNQLSDRIRRQPYSLVLFDEIEKAHPEVFNILLQILEDGYLTDSKGRRVNFSDTIIIMTSNAGAEKLYKEADLGFRASAKSDLDHLETVHQKNSHMVIEELKNYMRPELINRIDKMIVFNALTKKDASRILKLQIEMLANKLKEHNLTLSVSGSVQKMLLDKGYDAQNGVRPLRRVIQDEIEDYVANALLRKEFTKGDTVSISSHKGKIIFNAVHE